jgi:hypothetical protein
MLTQLIDSLKRCPDTNDVFNPWWEVDKDNDISEQAPFVRRQQLFYYLSERLGIAKYILIGEAIGYQGGKFTGIPMTSERILLDGQKKKGIFRRHILKGIKIKRTSKTYLKPEGYSEPTGTIIWEQIIKLRKNPYELILWNAFPWHPYDPKIGKLSNRTPRNDELKKGDHVLLQFFRITKTKDIIAIGEKAYNQLNRLEIKAIKVRHPAHGGAIRFRQQLTQIIP